jgi:2-isopropylmalate synthase
VLYIPVDPADIGRTYKAIIRINSQSGKGGVAYVMEKDFGFDLPKAMHKEFGRVINDLADVLKAEITPDQIHEAFLREYITRDQPVKLEHFRTTERDSQVKCEAAVNYEGKVHKFIGAGNGPIDAFVNGLGSTGVPAFELLFYSEHSLGKGAEARAVAYIQIKSGRGVTFFGAGIDTSIELASIKALVSAVNRSLAKR